MSYNFDGKVVNQSPSSIPYCSKCKRLLAPPKDGTLAELSGDKIFETYSYLGTKHFIYETKSGTAAVYCSEYCRNKHNHRFTK